MATFPNKLTASLAENAQAGKKSLAVLIDPDKLPQNFDELARFVSNAQRLGIDYFLIGGSFIRQYVIRKVVEVIHQYTDIPAILFPGNSLHIEPTADAILFISLISGRNADYLIGQHVIAAPLINQAGMEVLPTGYILVESGSLTTAVYMSGSAPVPRNKPEVAAITAMAGAMLGLKYMYLDAGSGANKAVPRAMIASVKEASKVPLIVGGGIDSVQLARRAWDAGADVIVVGNGIEKNPGLLPEIAGELRKLEAIC